MQLDPTLLIVSAIGVVLLAGLLWAWKRYTELWKRYADERAEHEQRMAAFRVEHERQVADLRVEHQQEIKKACGGSVRQSRSVLLGNAVEQIAPMVPSFCKQFSPSDARFLGAPIDYVIFDGLAEGRLERVIFLEVKSGANTALNKNEREIQRAIEEGRVQFEMLPLAPPKAPRAVGM
jgi:predicted Holliday junction resolvase-like endonuclease